MKQNQFRTTYCEAKPVENHLSWSKTSLEPLIVKENQLKTTHREAKLVENHLSEGKLWVDRESNWGKERVSFTQLFFQDCNVVLPEIALSETQQHSSAALPNIQDIGSSFLLSLQYHITTLLLLMHSQHAHALFTLHSHHLHPNLSRLSSSASSGYITSCLCPTFRMFQIYQKDVFS